jgi:5'-3' exonuclease
MTVTGLTSLFKKFNIPFLGRPKKANDTIPAYLNQLSGRILAVDTSMIVYKVHSRAIDDMCRSYMFLRSEDGRWSRPDPTELMEYFKVSMRSFIEGMRKTQVNFIFVMEGEVPHMKEKTSAKRREDRLQASLIEYDDEQQHIENIKHKYLLSEEHKYATIEILKDLGCKVLQAKYESEGVCDYLVKSKKAHGVLSDDGDLVMLGSPIMIRKLRSLKLETGHFEYHGLCLVDLLINIGFLQEKYRSDHPDYIAACNRLRTLCILSGTDYHPGVFRMGILKIHTLMMEHNCYTYDDVCKVDERFLTVPYHEIISTLDNNTLYTIL